MLRKLFASDIPQLLAIENSVHIAPWNEETFKICFQVGYMGWAIEVEKKIIGFIVVSLSIEECHILNLCVVHEHQHQGWGQKLLVYALQFARQQGVSMAYLEVRRTNTRAIWLYEKSGFKLIGERKNYYPTVEGYEDALVFGAFL
jgi:ribosomal-protein-alanine N-acetyltransferase